MKRRSFIANSLLTAGGVWAGSNSLYAETLKEINQQFSANQNPDGYDLIINGAGLSGYFAAIEAARIGLQVLILDKRTSPGYDIAAKNKLWIKSDGYKELTKEQTELFFPVGELGEMFSDDKKSLKLPDSSLFDDELLLFSGSIKKGLLRSLLANKVHVMLMTDVCGIISDNTGVHGVLVANKQGLYTIQCKSFLDATENVLFTRELFNQKYKIKKAGFVIELIDVAGPVKNLVKVNESFNIVNNSITLHKGKKAKDQQFIGFEFLVEENDLSAIEQKARFIATKLSKNFSAIAPSFSKAKLYNFALECFYFLENNSVPIPSLNGYYCSNGPTLSDMSCINIFDLAAASKKLVGNIKLGTANQNKKVIQFIGGNIPYNEKAKSKNVTENGVFLPLSLFIPEKNMEIQEMECQVLVAGGGTAGATAAIGAAEKGAYTLLAEYFNDLGGTKTMGGVSGYYHGLVDHPFVKQLEKNVADIKREYNLAGGIERRFYLLKTITDLGCKFLSGVIICGAITKNKKLISTIICENGKLKKLTSTLAIDATGDADIAYFAGEQYKHGNSRTGITQNYSQWDISGRINMPSNTGRDYDIIDNTKISELQRGLFLSHYESHFYDFCPMLTVRESRMPKGVYTITVKDVFEGTHHGDTIARSSSDFDPHYVGSSEYSRCGFLLPHSNKTIVEIPFRSIVPATVDGLLLSGRGISQTNNAMQFTRMSGDVITLGYITGQIASDISSKKIQARDYDVAQLQNGWKKMGFLPSGPQDRKVETLPEKVVKLTKGEAGYLLKCCLLPPAKVLPVLLAEYKRNNNLHVAKALAWFSHAEGVAEIIQELEELFNQEIKTGYSANFLDKYDSTGQYWRINQNIGLLAMAGSNQGNETILSILNQTNSGGAMVIRESTYYDNRIDLKLIPQYNRINNLCFYIERQPDSIFISELEKLLKDKNIGNYKTTEYKNTRWRVYGADLELYIGVALARCGSMAGFELLINYLDEIHSNFRGYSLKELKSITNEDYGYETIAWSKYFNNKRGFPIKASGVVKEIEL